MTTTKQTIYVYAEHCQAMGGQVYTAIQADEEAAGKADGIETEMGADVYQWGEGTEEELVAEARDRLARGIAAGAAGSNQRKAARNVLRYFDAE